LLTTLLVLAGGLLLAQGLSSGRQHTDGASAGPLRQTLLSVGAAFERSDELLRRWPVAFISLLALAALFGLLLFCGSPG
jgi:hypothetical protein